MSTLEIRQIGDALVLILPKALLKKLNAKPGDSLKYSFEDGKLVIKPKVNQSCQTGLRFISFCLAERIFGSFSPSFN